MQNRVHVSPSTTALTLFAALLIIGCGGGQQAVKKTETKIEVPNGGQRFTLEVAVQRYRVDLNVDPRTETFSGVSEIDVIAEAPVKVVHLHAEGMTSVDAVVRVAGREVKARTVAGEGGSLAIVPATPLPVGESTLVITFDAPLPKQPLGLYRVEDGERWYAFTQFEPLEARKAFPCFDQPDVKVPFTFRVRVPKEMVALTNSRELSRAADTTEAFGADWLLFTFEETKPLPTYLIAFAVGELDLFEAPAGAIGEAPLRIVTTKGKSGLAGFAAETTPPLLKYLEEYFGTPYPYTKLDLVAVPNFGSGAMENPGLITFRERLILLDKDKAPAGDRKSSQAVNAHELAHLWFGDLVTPAWWDDLWLNEAFATWMGTKVLGAVDPSLETRVSAVRGTQWVMGLDTKAHARAIHNPIRHAGDIYNAFDGITYVKGRAVLTMMEAWMGEDAFREGVRAYIAAHAHGVATTKDLMDALAESSGKPVWDVTKAFIDQPGVPLVDVAMACGAKKTEAATVTLSQRRFLPDDSTADAGTPWRIPVCMRYEIKRKTYRECFDIATPTATVQLATAGCPTWLHPNADETGYYRWTLAGDALTQLAGKHLKKLTTAERVALPGHLAALLETGHLEVGAYVDALKALAADKHPIVVQGLISGLSTLHANIASDEALPKLAKLVGKLLGKHLKRIKTKPSAKDTDLVKMLRPRLVRAMGWMAGDAGLKKTAWDLSHKWLADPASVEPEVIAWALPMAAWDGDEAFWRALVGALANAATPQLRGVVIEALGSFQDPELLERTFGLLFDGSLRSQDLRTVFRAAGQARSVRQAPWAWAKTNYDKILELIGEKYAARLPNFAGGMCSAEVIEDVKAFFAEEGHSTEGTDRNVGLVVESIDRCVKMVARHRAALDAKL